ncbi:hypothetical protein [Teichococcus deserti]|uniref:hypothetical protein n=1 Tax=Teichococcus deserti TaxID=1817963 RepID=UPI0013F5F73E|nr:hypothetical protein [Pseudoroseomonas deserti]
MAHSHQASFGVLPAQRQAAPRPLALGPARGIMIGLGLSALLWTGVFFLVRPYFF